MAQDEAKASARNEVDEGVQAFRQAHYEDAIAHFEQAIANDPDLVVARMYLAATYLQVFEPGVDTPENVIWATKALDQYSEILRRNPSDVESLKGVAYLKLQLNELPRKQEKPMPKQLHWIQAILNCYTRRRWQTGRMQADDIEAEKAKLDAESEYSLILSDSCSDVRAKSLAIVDSAHSDARTKPCLFAKTMLMP